ncbi:MAG TPA: Rieske (2Fe-2S) protein [Stackebrandtia sp.]|jgi:nitrite reductase/ring-hydroxylating ferredoxin subunit|uniref:Rieske (2Fe-2S) protein n=1 Tax=Stackebrandtia sp. TaxID=2023065 RepID=UPI002D3964E4|nr:Rieske (2Fe-2S) protein [Stackebrandtia sp.]HZE40321.1 Rieske (2Fe-2S) protein [Stackebrandtia sp.]
MTERELSPATARHAADIAAQVARTSRRGLLCGAFGVSAAAVLAACGSSSDTGSSGGEGDKQDSKDDNKDKAVAKVADIPVGGGIAAGSLILTQPKKGTVVAFNRACTHEGFKVNAPKDGVITCPKHGSQFKAADGSVEHGPAASPLKKVKVTVKNGGVYQA